MAGAYMPNRQFTSSEPSVMSSLTKWIYWQFYNTSLLMNEDCDTQDAMEYLTAKFRTLSESTGNSVTDVDLFLSELFESKFEDT